MKQNYFLFFVLYFIYTTLGYSQIVNKGILKIMPATTVYFGNNYTNDLTHNNDGNLHLKGDFVNNGTTTAASSSTTHFTGSAAIQEIKGSANKVNFYDLVINNTFKGVSVINAFELNVENGVTLTNGDLRLLGEAQLIQTHAGTTANGSTNGKLLRYQQGLTSKFGYNYWSSPVNNGGTVALNGGLCYGADPSSPVVNPNAVGKNGSVTS